MNNCIGARAPIDSLSNFYNSSTVEYRNIVLENNIQIINVPQKHIGISGYNYLQIELIQTSIKIMLR